MRRRWTGSGSDAATWSVLLTLVFLSACLRALAAEAVSGPWFTPDEMIYAALGQSLWTHARFEILGANPGFFSFVYPALVGLPLHVLGVARGYALLKPVQALIVSVTAVPVYWWARSLMPARWALAPATLSVCLPGLAFAGFLMTEVLFLPLFCLAAWTMARALVKPTLRRQALMLAAISLAALTRLEALALAPAFVFAALLEATVARAWLQRLRAHAPAFACMAAGLLAWSLAAAAKGSSPLGAYAVVGDGRYSAAAVARFTIYHAADVVLLTGVVPVLAVLLLAASADVADHAELRAYLSVTAASTATLLVVVGSFASRFTGRLAERNLFVLAPLFFLGFGCWLARGLPRTRRSLLCGAVVTLAVLSATPWHSLVRPAGEPDAFTLVPLVELRQALPSVDPLLVVLAVGIGAVALVAASGRRPLALVLAVAAALVGTSVQVSRFAAHEARTYQWVMVGGQTGWIDTASSSPVVFLYGGELGWSRGAPAWANAFWNERVAGIDELFGHDVEGPVRHRPTSIAADGRVLVDGQEQRQFGWAVASNRFALVGSPVASSTAALTLWRIVPPLRLVTAKSGFDPGTAELSARARLTVWDCRGGALALTLSALAGPATVRVEHDGARLATVRLGAGERWSGTVQFARETTSKPCVVELRGARGVRADRIELLPAAAGAESAQTLASAGGRA